MTTETFRPDTTQPIGDTLGLKVGDVVTHKAVKDRTFVIVGFAPGWDETCAATVVASTGDESGNIAPGIFQAGAWWFEVAK